MKHLGAALLYVMALLQFGLSFSTEDPSGHLIAGWIAWALGTVFVVWDIVEEE